MTTNNHNNSNGLSNFSSQFSSKILNMAVPPLGGGKSIDYIRERKNIDSKEQILEVASELALNFLTYDREGDSDLSEDVVLTAIESGLVTVDEIVESFREALLDSLPD